MNFTIEKGVPYPKKGKKGFVNYPFDEMEVGDSFFVPLKKGNKITSLQPQILSNAKSYALHNKKDWTFKTSREEDETGIRIWRVS